MQSFCLIVLASLGFVLIAHPQPILNKTQPTCPEWIYWGAPSPFDGSPNPLTEFLNATSDIKKEELSKDETMKKYKIVLEQYCRVGHPLVKNETHQIYQTWSTCHHIYEHRIGLHRMIHFSWLLDFMCINQDQFSNELVNEGEMNCYSRKNSRSKCRDKSIIEERMNEPFNLCTQLRLSWEKVECKRAELIKCGKIVEVFLNYQGERVSKCNGTNKENFDRSIQFQL